MHAHTRKGTHTHTHVAITHVFFFLLAVLSPRLHTNTDESTHVPLLYLISCMRAHPNIRCYNSYSKRDIFLPERKPKARPTTSQLTNCFQRRKRKVLRSASAHKLNVHFQLEVSRNKVERTRTLAVLCS